MRLKIGELATRTGLTVRTLHHYDAIGLLCPSARSERGYRLYTPDDVARLHRIQALKQFGFALARIGALLEHDAAQLRPLVAQQLQVLDAQVVRAQALRRRLADLHMQLERGDAPDLSEWLRTLELMNVYDKHFTPEELGTLRAHRQAAAADGALQWQPLITEVRAAMAQGLAPEDEAVQALAQRWQAVAVAMVAGNAQLLHKLHTVTRDEPAMQAASGIDPAVQDYMGRAGVALRTAHFAAYLSPDELAQLRERVRRNEGAWLELVGALRAHMAASGAPTDPAARALAQRWHALHDATYPNGDPGLRAKMHQALGELRLRAMRGGGLIDRDLLDFVWQATLEPLPYPAEAGARPSPSALSVAMLRAAHQVFDTPRILDDPLALRIVGTHNAALLETLPHWMDNPFARPFRAAMVVRSRVAEDALREAIGRGVRQYVILGAGLDTSAYRLGGPADLRSFEVDHPTVQSAKRLQLDQAGIVPPDGLRYVATDFETTHLANALREAGFSAQAPAFFSLLGVSMYLDASALWQTLGLIAACAPGSAVVFDYALSPEHLGPREQAIHAGLTQRGAAQGEPWKSFFTPAALHAGLRDAGFAQVDDLDRETLHARYIGARADGLGLGGVTRIAQAWV